MIMRIFTLGSLIFLLFFSSVLLVQKHGLLHPEALERIPHYLDERNLFQKMYDIDRNEYGLYQARELSHFFDYVDANFIKLSSLAGLPHFFSLTYFISIFLIILSCLYISKTYFNHKNLLAPSLIIMIYLFSPVVFFSTYMFRSAKILVALAIVFTWFLTLRFLSQESPHKKTSLIIILSSLFLASGDRQGLYVLISLAGFLFFSSSFFLKNKHFKLFKLLAIGTLVSLFYSYVVAPILIRIDIGHFPSFSYHKIDFHLIKPIFFRFSTLYSLDIFKYFFGNLNRILIIFLLLNFFLMYIVVQAKTIGEMLKHFFLITSGIFTILLLNTLMILKHNAIPLEDVRRVYYSLPLTTIIVLSCLYFVGVVMKTFHKTGKYFFVLLFLILILNVFSLAEHFSIIRNGLLKNDYEYSSEIIDCLHSGYEKHKFAQREDLSKFCELITK